jgi:hypothetical protein
MAHLSSCYFCGTALESPVEAYELSGGTGASPTTVSLCPSCKEKLDIVLESAERGTLTPAGDTQPRTEPEAGAPDELPEGSEASDSPDASVEPDNGRTDQETESDKELASGDELPDDEELHEADDEIDDPFDDELLPEDDPLAEEVDANEDGSLADDVDADEDDPLAGDVGSDSSETDEELSEEGSSDEIGRSDDGDRKMAESADNRSSVDNTADERVDDETEPAGNEQEERTQATDGQADGASGGNSASDDGDNGAGDQTPSGTTISALEYNRVMRMLQNREFPVDREEIVLVASNAYDIAQSECAQVIDLAVDRGLLDERDGKLYRPED